MSGLRNIRKEPLTAKCAGWALAVSLCAVMLACTATPEWPVITPAPLPTPDQAYPDPELGDCFGGVFSRVDPMQCYVLERAQGEGVIDIDKVYEGDGILRISLRQDAPEGASQVRASFLDDQVILFLRERTAEFLDRWPHLVPYYGWCTDDIGGPRNERRCILNIVSTGRSLPPTADYRAILFHVGGGVCAS